LTSSWEVLVASLSAVSPKMVSAPTASILFIQSCFTCSVVTLAWGCSSPYHTQPCWHSSCCLFGFQLQGLTKDLVEHPVVAHE
jgi:hypothetical protein